LFQDYGITAQFFQALQAYWDELSTARVSVQRRPAKRVNQMKQFLVFSGGVMVAAGLKLGGSAITESRVK
jgi:hypothetical protein